MSYRSIPSSRAFFSFDNSQPLFIYTLGMYKEGKKYQRREYGLLDSTGNIGGFGQAIKFGLFVSVMLFSDISINLQKFKQFDFILKNDDERD